MTRHERVAWTVGGAGLVGASIGWVLDPRAFYGGSLAALTVFAGWPLGSVALLLIHSLTGGRWGDDLRSALLLGVSTLPLLLPAVVPVVAGLSVLYPWTQPGAGNFYLNVPFLAWRGMIYLLIWFALGGLALGRFDLARIASAGLFLLAVSTSFAAIDTTMSLDVHFNSSIYGMLSGCGMVLLALSIAVLLTALGVPREPRADLAKLVLALVVLWIYLDFMQLLIVWQSDLAAEVPWYLARASGFWGAVRLVVAVGHFMLPVALLLSPRAQRSPRTLMAVAGLLVAMEVVRGWWTVLPSLGGGLGWIDLVCMAAYGGIGAGTALLVARRRSAAGEMRHVG